MVWWKQWFSLKKKSKVGAEEIIKKASIYFEVEDPGLIPSTIYGKQAHQEWCLNAETGE